MGLRIKEETRIIPKFCLLFLCASWFILNHDSKITQKEKDIWENSIYNTCHFKSSNQGDMVAVGAPILAKV